MRYVGLCIAALVVTGCFDQVAAPTPAPPTATVTELNETVIADDTPARAVEIKSPALEAPSTDGHNHLTREEIAAGWIKLFDGHTLFGWEPNTSTQWDVVDGVITASGGADKALLVTTTRFADYDLRCDFRLEKGGNSGIFLRTPKTPTNPAVDCYELNVWDEAPEYKSASLVGRAKPLREVELAGDWHSYFVTLDGTRVSVKLDGQPILEYIDEGEPPLKSGLIGLQMNGGKVEFRNVYLRPLGLTDLFDGESLAGWREVPGSQSKFEVKDGAIHVTGGRGFLETERTAADFILQFDAQTHGDGLNSGVFFRADPGREEAPSNGYEFQIHNGFQNGDRAQPQDHGTGAIFNRVKARRVVANDHQWLTATLVADGAHFTTWVDGIQMVDWTDNREPDVNPRKGLRLNAGHFSLQGHDPTSDLSFRRFRSAVLPPR